MNAVIVTHDLTRYFGKYCAVDRLSIQVPQGAITAFLGRNGSGKTTTIRMLLGMLEPTRGSSSIFGYDSQALPPGARARIGYLAENHPLYGWMNVQQACDFQSAFYANWNQKLFDAVLEHFSLRRDAKAGSLSRGQRAGLALALTMAPEPELLILDDPTLGLDPVARRAFLESMIYTIRTPGRSILLSSHILVDVERVADHVIILDRARLRADCPIEVFRRRVVQYSLTFSARPPALPDIPGLLDVLQTDHMLRITVANAGEASRKQLEALNPISIEEHPVSLEDAVTSYMSENRKRGFLAGTV